MSEILLRIASKNRVKSGVSLSHDFTIKYNDPIKLSYNMKHELAVRMIKMTYSWYNIRLGKQSHLPMGCIVMMILIFILKNT